MINYNDNFDTELTLEEETSVVDFVKCKLYDERFMNKLDKLGHVERKHRETFYGKRKRQNLRLEDLENDSDSDNCEPENDAKNQENIPLKKKARSIPTKNTSKNEVKCDKCHKDFKPKFTLERHLNKICK